MTMTAAEVVRSTAGRPADEGPPDHRPAGERSAEALGAAAALFRGLADPTRLLILNHLALGEHRVVDLTQHVGLAQSTVSAHLACLRDCGLVQARPQGRSTMWSLARPELADLLRSAEQLLEATGQRVALCPTYGTPRP